MLNDFQLTKNFKLYEFQCKCCGQVKIGSDLVNVLQKLRDKFGALTIISGYRCRTHNKDVGGATNSYHVQGRACDINVSFNVKEFIKYAHKLGIRGIGYYPNQNFIHLDNRETIKQTYWIKKDKYNYISYDKLIELA